MKRLFIQLAGMRSEEKVHAVSPFPLRAMIERLSQDQFSIWAISRSERFFFPGRLIRLNDQVETSFARNLYPGNVLPLLSDDIELHLADFVDDCRNVVACLGLARHRTGRCATRNDVAGIKRLHLADPRHQLIDIPIH